MNTANAYFEFADMRFDQHKITKEPQKHSSYYNLPSPLLGFEKSAGLLSALAESKPAPKPHCPEPGVANLTRKWPVCMEVNRLTVRSAVQTQV